MKLFRNKQDKEVKKNEKGWSKDLKDDTKKARQKGEELYDEAKRKVRDIL